MVEAGSKEVSEEDMLEALMFGHEAIKELIAFEEEIIEAIGEEKMEYDRLEISSELRSEVDEFCRDRVDAALRIKDKLEKYAAIDKVKEEIDEILKDENMTEEEKKRQQQEQQSQQDEEQISKENAEQILNALMQDEKDIQEKQKKMMQQHQGKTLDKDW